jgi:hypothetical protein
MKPLLIIAFDSHLSLLAWISSSWLWTRGRVGFESIGGRVIPQGGLRFRFCIGFCIEGDAIRSFSIGIDLDYCDLFTSRFNA